jgi:hypothetical protein
MQYEFVFVRGLRGPEGQLWHEPQVNGHGMKKEVLFSQSVNGDYTLDQYIMEFKEAVFETQDC